MSEPDPFASPYQVVHLPGQQPVDQSPMVLGWPAPMPSASIDHVVPGRPAPLTAAFWCWLAGTLLVVIGLPAVFLTGTDAAAVDLYNDSQLSSPTPMTKGTAELTARLLPAMCAFGLAVLAVPFVIATVKLRGGRNWARVLLAVLGGLGLMFGLIMLASFIAGTPWANWLVGISWSLVFLGTLLLGLILMFLPAANDYVRFVGGRR